MLVLVLVLFLVCWLPVLALLALEVRAKWEWAVTTHQQLYYWVRVRDLGLYIWDNKMMTGRVVLWGVVGWANWARFGLEINKNKKNGYRNRKEQRHFQRGYEGQRGFWGGRKVEEVVEDKEHDYRKALRESRVYAGRREFEGRREHKVRDYESRRDYGSRREHREKREYDDRRE